MAEYLSTGIHTLDRLLGGNGIPIGSCVLVRGAPGAGKTTLALQIAQRNLDNENLKQRAFSATWVAAEQEPRESIGQVLESLFRETYDKFKKRHGVSFSDLSFRRGRDLPPHESIGFPDVFFTTSREVESRNESTDAPDESVDPERLLVQADSLLDFLCVLWSTRPIRPDAPSLVVIDSLNALALWAQRRWPATSERRAVLDVLRSIAIWNPKAKYKPTAILTAETPGDVSDVAGQSYVADVVIELFHDELAYQLPTHFEDPAEWKVAEQVLLSCRVTKGRGLPIQRRSSCYEFVPRKEASKGSAEEFSGGLKFFPTYASPGLVSLFYENDPQRKEIDDFGAVDIPRQFPRVDVQGFSRSDMQRMYAIQRYQESIPSRLPLALSSVDEHWVSVLAEKELVQPIAPEDLRLYSMPGMESPKDTLVIEELHQAKRQFYRDQRTKAYLAVPYMVNVGMLVYRRDLLEEIGAGPPETWEELEKICKRLQKNGSPHRLLIETKTYDTLMATALELCWGHGAWWRTEPKTDMPGLKVVYQNDASGGKGSFSGLVKAIERLKRWVHDEKNAIVPPRSSVDPSMRPDLDWVFARHWYSTWVDVLTKKDKDGKVLCRCKRGPTCEKGPTIVDLESEGKFGFAPIPISRAYRERQKKQAARKGTLPENWTPKHHSCWGEWYLAIQEGSENTELGVELINNLMTSRKVTERALSGAGIPTVEPFYDTWGNHICYGTDLTYKDLREMLYKGAQSRTAFAEYRKVARILSGALNAILSNPNADVAERLKTAIDEMGR